MGEWTAWQVIAWAIGGLGGGAFVAAYFTGLLNALLPSPARLAGLIRQRDLPLPSGERFVVLIADLQGDDADKSQTRHVAAALAPYRGLDVQRIGPGPEWDVGSRDAFEAKARALLAERRGDVLISGDVASAGKGLRLRILPSEASASAQGESAQGRRPGEYTLTETGLPRDFDQDFNVVLLAIVVASIAPATARQGHYLVDALEPAAGRLKHLCAHMPGGLEPDQRGSLWDALGLASFVLGEQTGESDWLQQAVQAYRAALEIRTPERVPLDWAGTQNNLGTALSRRGARAGGTARLEEAVAAYRAALEVWARERVPLDWAMTQNNLGNALSPLGEREDGTVRLEEAVAACRAALEVWTRERVPLDWAIAQNNLGTALQTFGEREDGTARLDEAVAAYRAALEVYTRERVPLQWAMTQNNVGTALSTLGEREDGTERLEAAVAALRGALEAFRSAGASYYVDGIARNLARAEALLAKRLGPTAAE